MKNFKVLALMAACMLAFTACGESDTQTSDGAQKIEDALEVDANEDAVEVEGDYVEASSEDFDYSEVDGAITLNKYKGEASYIIVPEEINGLKVTVIATGCFSANKNIVGVNLPESVITIAEHSFDECESLEKVQLGNSVETIGDKAFINCWSLKEINLPDSITEMGESALNACAITSIHIPAGLTAISDGAFCNGDWEELTIPGNVLTIGKQAFAANSVLKTVYIQDGVETIGSKAFQKCSALEEIHIPASVTSFGEDGSGKIVDSADGITIYAPSGSAAEEYANSKGFNFVAE